MAAAYDPVQWHDFGTSFAAAAGALLGLAFVAISFNLDPILQGKALPDRAIETLAFFAYAMAASLLIQLPGLSGLGLGVGEAILAAGVVVLVVRSLPRWRQERGDPLSWRLTHFSPAALTASLAIVGAPGHDDHQRRRPVLAGRRHDRRDRVRADQQLGPARRDPALTCVATVPWRVASGVCGRIHGTIRE